MTQANLFDSPQKDRWSPLSRLKTFLTTEGERLPSLRAVCAWQALALAKEASERGERWFLTPRTLPIALGVTTDSLLKVWRDVHAPPMKDIEFETKRRLKGLEAHGQPQEYAPSSSHWLALKVVSGREEGLLALLQATLDEDLSDFEGGDQEKREARQRETRQAQPRLDVSVFPFDPYKDPYIALDVETTGLSPGKNRITEVALVQFEEGEVTARMSQLINPLQPIPRQVRELTGITPAMVRDKPVFGVVAPRLRARLQAVPRIVGHNLGFDVRFLTAELGRFDLDWPQMVAEVDTQKVAKRVGSRQRKLGPLCSHYGITLENAHRALDDAEATGKLYQALYKVACQRWIEGVGGAR